MAALREIGYTGWATAEIPGGGRDRLAAIATHGSDLCQLNRAAGNCISPCSLGVLGSSANRRIG